MKEQFHYKTDIRKFKKGKITFQINKNKLQRIQTKL